MPLGKWHYWKLLRCGWNNASKLSSFGMFGSQHEHTGSLLQQPSRRISCYPRYLWLHFDINLIKVEERYQGRLDTHYDDRLINVGYSKRLPCQRDKHHFRISRYWKRKFVPRTCKGKISCLVETYSGVLYG